MSSNNVYDVIVIGAGLSGLSSAKLLKEFGGIENILVLEANDRVGGRTFTSKNDQCKWVDLGGSYVGRHQSRLLRMIKEFGLKLYSVNEKENIVYYQKKSRNLFHYDEIPALDFFTLLDFNNIMRLIDKMGEEIPADRPWAAPHAEQWDKITFQEFLEQKTSNQKVLTLMKTVMTTIVTTEPWESSLLWILWYVKQCNGIYAILSTTNGGQEFKVDGGTMQISERMVDSIGRDKVLLNEPVHQLKQKQQKILIRTLNGKEFSTRYVIMAIAPAVQQKIHYQPPLPCMRNQLIQRAPMGSVLKCMVYYEENFWRQNDMCGSSVINGDEKHPITFTFDDCKENGSYPALVGFIPADKARKMIEMTKEERLKLICESYAKCFNDDRARQPIHYEEHNWMSEQYTGGCYTMTCPPGFLTRYGPYLRQPIGRIHFAGTETAAHWSGYMEGAIEAGERAAREVLAEMGRIKPNEIWIDEPLSKDYPPIEFKRSWIERNLPTARGFWRFVMVASMVTLLTTLKVRYC